MKAVIDSDVLIDFLKGVPEAKKELALYSDRCVSLISWMEIMSGTETPEEERQCRSFLMQFRVIEIGREIAEQAVMFRRAHHLKLPDALILATAHHAGCILVTRNTKDFTSKTPGIRIPYRLS
ncbi:MAG: type II toxin-antitoxin system VapC family toxin [Nitrospirae bacterium]|nr:type II toxin-antitoxin system VapC family toxin [Candidatus Troglogloeales bacterium]